MFSHSIEREPLGVSDHSFRKCALQVRPSHKKKNFWYLNHLQISFFWQFRHFHNHMAVRFLFKHFHEKNGLSSPYELQYAI